MDNIETTSVKRDTCHRLVEPAFAQKRMLARVLLIASLLATFWVATPAHASWSNEQLVSGTSDA